MENKVFLIFQDFGNRYVRRSDRSEMLCLFCVLPPTPRPGPGPFLQTKISKKLVFWKTRKIGNFVLSINCHFMENLRKLGVKKSFLYLKLRKEFFFLIFQDFP